MKRNEIALKIRRACYLYVDNIKGRFYDDGAKLEVIGDILYDGEEIRTSFYLNKQTIIDSTESELLKIINFQIRASLQA